MEKGTEKTEVKDHHLVRMEFRELWDKGARNKRIWLRAVNITESKEVDDRELSAAKEGSEN